MNHLLNWHAHSLATWEACLQATLAFQASGQTWTQQAAGRSLGMLFFNPSLRTRTSMELAAAQLGVHATTLNVGQGTWGFAWEERAVMDGGEAEHIREAVGVLSRYYDALGVRLFASGTDYDADRTDARLHQFAEAATVPVVNLESAFFHPCQALADAAALHAHFGGTPRGKKFVLTWAYHPKALPMAVPNSALLAAARLGCEVSVVHPEGFALAEPVLAQAHQYAESHGTTITETSDRAAAFADADVIYAKAWGGQLRYEDAPAEAALRQQHRNWRVTADWMARTNKAVFMHCLPVRRNVVVDDAVLDSAQAIHLLQAEMRLHAQKAILAALFEGGAS